jgi:Ca2+-binding RTX toxin-like protein
LADVVFSFAGNDKIETFEGDDIIFAGFGHDWISASAGNDTVFAGAGNDTVSGGDGNDYLYGGFGDDVVVGDKGDDVMIGGFGNDVLVWNNGDGSDIISGGAGYDTVEVNGSSTAGDNFVLGRNADGKAFFERTGLDGQVGTGRFTLTVDTSERFDVNAGGGNDTFVVNDLAYTGVEVVEFDGGEGNDLFDASNSSVKVKAEGGVGNDTLIGSRFADTIIGGDGVDTLTGGKGRDLFVYNGDPFANGTPALNAATGINALNQPDVITDYTIGEDVFALGRQALGIDSLIFQNGFISDITGNGNVIVLQGGFANAAAAAAAIRDNNAITADEGVFVYFNINLGISRLVYSEDLGDGGDISVLANLTNQAGDTGLANLANFTASDFALV